MDAFSVDSLSELDKPIGLGEQGGGARIQRACIAEDRRG